MLVALVTILLGFVVAVVLAWLVLSGVMALAFHRARMFLRRVAERRRQARSGAAERRQLERRAH